MIDKGRCEISTYCPPRPIFVKCHWLVHRNPTKSTRIASVLRSKCPMCRGSSLIRSKWSCSHDAHIQSTNTYRHMLFSLPQSSRKPLPLKSTLVETCREQNSNAYLARHIRKKTCELRSSFDQWWLKRSKIVCWWWELRSASEEAETSSSIISSTDDALPSTSPSM